MAHAVGKNLCASAWKRIHTRRLQLFQSLSNRKPGTLGKVRHLDHGESFQVHLRKALLQSVDEIEEILEWQIRMQAAYDVKYRDCLGISRGRGLECLVQSHGVSAGRVFFATEGTQPASCHANVGRVQMAVD